LDIQKLALRSLGAFGATLLVASAATAHQRHPYICGTNGDATSNYVNASGRIWNQLITQPNGSDLPGFICDDIDGGYKLFVDSIHVTVLGKNLNTTNGPFLFLNCTKLSDNSPLVLGIPISQGKIIQRSSVGATYSFGSDTFGVTSDTIRVHSLAFQIFPTATAFNSKMSGVTMDLNSFLMFTKQESICPGGPHP